MGDFEGCPVFLIGAQRSGTTALAYCLSEAYSMQEGIFTVNGKLFYYLNRWLTEEDIFYRHFRVDEILYSLKRKLPGGRQVEFWLDRVEKVLRHTAIEIANGCCLDSIALGKSIIFNCYEGFQIWGDKYNEYLHMLPYINSIVPNSRFILLYRSPVETSNSVENWYGDRPWRATTFNGNMDKWAFWYSDPLQFLTKLPRNRYIVIEYHRLCRGEETQKISSFLNMEIKPYLNSLSVRRNKYEVIDFLPLVNDIWSKLNHLAQT
ncbi:sulfotransferase [Bacillus cereus]|uniref:sulfotransferase n=1 Tax=Bacillus cereus TaxID=1396 RepID=UPI003555E6D7